MQSNQRIKNKIKNIKEIYLLIRVVINSKLSNNHKYIKNKLEKEKFQIE